MPDIDNTFNADNIPPDLRTFSQMTESQQKERIGKGLQVPADDLEPGMFITVYGHKSSPDTIVNCMGMPMKVMSINLPYVVAEVQGSGDHIILDDRFLVFMRITKEYAEMAGKGFPKAS